MSDDINSPSPETTPTTTVIGRVEGVDTHGRPRLLRCFYPEDAYTPGGDQRKHIAVPFAAKDVAKVKR